ncbi:alcohol acetyltransferase [Mycena capillaripes]|nr:alcohol acetyltransferase [Mycena capillaripes]
MECFHTTRHFLGLDSCVVACAQYTTQDGLALTKELLFPALRTLIETHASLGLRLEGDEATANVFLVRLPKVDLSRIVEFSGKRDLQAAFEGQLSRNFETQTDLPLWRVEVLAENIVVFAVHHAIGDGMSSLAFHLNLFKALQNGRGGDTSPVVPVPTTNVLLPPVDRATSVRPSIGTICSELWTLMAPVAWTKARSAWTGPPSPLTPDLTTCVRIVTLPAPDVAAFCAVGRIHHATLTSTIFVLALSSLSRLISGDPARYTRIAGGIAISLRDAAGVPDDAICDYPTVFHALPRVAPDFSWSKAAHFAAVLKEQKRKGREIIGMLRFLFGDYVSYMKSHLGKKREVGFGVSNLGRVQISAVEGKWTMGRTIFAHGDVVTAAAFNIDITGDPTGALNIAFTWGEKSIETAFVQTFIASFLDGFQAVVGQNKLVATS